MLGILPSAIIACSSVTTSNPGGGSAGTSGRASISDAGAVSANGFGGRSTSGSSNAGGSGRTSSGSGGTSANASGAANGSGSGRSGSGDAGRSGAEDAGRNGSGASGRSGSGDNTPKGVVVKLDAKHQTIQGFGLSTAWMPSGKNLPVDKVFGTDGADAIGLSILRVVMNPNGTLTGPFIPEAKAKGAKIIGSTSSPPASCKSNANTQKGGALLANCFDAWSTAIAKFAKAQGLYAMSIGNEPDFASCGSEGPPCLGDFDSTTFTAKEMAAWVKVAGPKLKAEGIKVIAPEVAEWLHAWSNASATGSLVAGHPQSSDPLNCGCYSNTPTDTGCAPTCLDGNGYDYGHWLWKDPEAWTAFDIFGVQQYDSQIAYAWPTDVNDGKKDKEVWQTEMSGIRYWPEEGPSSDIDNGVAVASWIHSALTVGEASAWLWSFYESFFENDNEGLALTKGSSTTAKRYFTLGNYSKFVRPSYIAVEVAGNTNGDVLLSAYLSPDDGTVVVVAVNRGLTAVSVPIAITGGVSPPLLTPTVTSATDNLREEPALTLTGGSFIAELPSMSVTTFSGK